MVRVRGVRGSRLNWKRSREAVASLVISAVTAYWQLRLLEMATNITVAYTWMMDACWKGGQQPFYRCRVLGPLITIALGNNLAAFEHFILIALFLAGLIYWRLDGVRGFAIFHAGFALLASPMFSGWDTAEMVLWPAFVVCVVERKSLRWFVPIFALAMLNRPTALFMAVWMVLHGLSTGKKEWQVVGIVCAGVGLAWMHTMNHSSGASSGPMDTWLSYRGDFAESHVWQCVTGVTWLTGSLYALILPSIWAIRRRYPMLALTWGLMFVGIFSLGAVWETRIYCDFIPLFALAAPL